MTSVLTALSTRELSIAFWASVFVLWMLTQPQLRRSIFGIFRTALHWKIAAPLVVCIAYVSAALWLLARIGFWKPTDVKDTVVWLVGSGFAAAFSGVQMSSQVPSVRQILRDQLGAFIVIEYLIGTFTFSFWVEFLVIPVIVFFSLMNGVAQTKQEFKSVQKATGCLLGVMGFVIAGFALRQAFEAIAQISLLSIARELALPIVLTAMLLPLAYAFFVISAYEQIFIRLKLGVADPAVRKYARRRLLRTLLVSPTRIRQFVDSNRGRFISAQSREEVDQWFDTQRERSGD